MNKYFLSIIVIATFIFYSFRIHTESKDALKKVVGIPTKNTKALYKNGTYKGNVTDAIYGNVEIQATIRNGNIAEIEFLQFPNHHQYSKTINPEALAQLATEAIEVQNAEVDIYSGATQTSKAFKHSLKTALDKALL